LLLRRRAAGKTSDKGKTLRRLWHRLPKDTVAEFKSTGRPYRSRNLDRLWSYLHIHYANQPARLVVRKDLCGVLLVPARTSSLAADAAAQGLSWHDLGAGYWQLKGGAFALYVAEIEEAATGGGAVRVQAEAGAGCMQAGLGGLRAGAGPAGAARRGAAGAVGRLPGRAARAYACRDPRPYR
jgi:hypothetical protein